MKLAVVLLLSASAPLGPASPRADAEHLAHELVEMPREKGLEALSRESRFRALCDADGYPVVGNVSVKGPHGVQPSEACKILNPGRKSR
jgi:hypothetical protein